MEVEVYTPKSITVPGNSNIERVFSESKRTYASDDYRSNVGEFDVLESPALYNQWIENLDKKTILFDVFFDSDKKLTGIGPRPYNLRDLLLRSMKVYVDGKRISFHLYEINEILYFKSRRALTVGQSSVNIKFIFDTFEETIQLNQVKTQTENLIINSASRTLTVTTLQKDNEIQWICDWILWHARLHRVERVVIYDNGSRNRIRLKEKLEDLKISLLCVMVDWHFPYGVYPFTSTRQGFLNHCRLRFPVDGGYCINLDIDEYLASPAATSFWEYLQTKDQNELLGVLNFKECKLPNVRNLGEHTSSVPRVFDYRYRFKRYGHHPTRESARLYTKYAYKFNLPIHARTHFAIFSYRECFALKQTTFVKLGYIFSLVKHKIMNEWQRFRAKRLKLRARQINARFMHVNMDESEFYFFHVMGLTSNFKSLPLKERTEYDESLHVHEPLIAKLSTLAKLDQE